MERANFKERALYLISPEKVPIGRNGVPLWLGHS